MADTQVYGVTWESAQLWLRGEIDDDGLIRADKPHVIFMHYLAGRDDWRGCCARFLALADAGAVCLIVRATTELMQARFKKLGALPTHQNERNERRYLVTPGQFARYRARLLRARC